MSFENIWLRFVKIEQGFGKSKGFDFSIKLLYLDYFNYWAVYEPIGAHD